MLLLLFLILPWTESHLTGFGAALGGSVCVCMELNLGWTKWLSLLEGLAQLMYGVHEVLIVGKCEVKPSVFLVRGLFAGRV